VFDFDGDKHHGKLEEAILEAVFNGSMIFFCLIILIHFLLAAKFCNECYEDYQPTAELRLALVKKKHFIVLLFKLHIRLGIMLTMLVNLYSPNEQSPYGK